MVLSKIIETSTRVWEWVTYRAGLLGSCFSIVMMLLIVAEVLARKLLHQSTLITYEIVAFGFAGIIFLGLAETRRAGGHLRIRLINDLLPPPVRKILEIIFSLITLSYLLFLLRYAVPMVVATYRAKSLTVGAVPLLVWPAQILMPIGLLVFAVLEFIYFLRQCFALVGLEPPPSAGIRTSKLNENKRISGS